MTATAHWLYSETALLKNGHDRNYPYGQLLRARILRKRVPSPQQAWDRSDALWTRVDWTQFGRDCIVNGRRVSYVDIGSGPTLLLVHGHGGCWRFWLRVLPKLAQRCRVIAVDLPGFGDSDTALGGDVMSEQVATLTSLVRQLGLMRVVVAGHSMGGLATIRVAIEDPAHFAGVVLVDAGGSKIGPKRLALILATFRVFHAVFGARVSRFVARHPALFRLLLVLALADTRSMSPSLALEIIPRMAAPGFISTMKAAAEEVNVARPEEIDQPALVVWGERDRILPCRDGRALADRMPNSRFVALDQVGHCPMIEAPDETAQLLGDFVVDTLRREPKDTSSPDHLRPASG